MGLAISLNPLILARSCLIISTKWERSPSVLFLSYLLLS